MTLSEIRTLLSATYHLLLPFLNSVQAPVCQDVTHIQGGYPPSQSAHSDTLKEYISLVSLNLVKLTIKINHDEKTEVARLWSCGPGDTDMSTVYYYWSTCFPLTWVCSRRGAV